MGYSNGCGLTEFDGHADAHAFASSRKARKLGNNTYLCQYAALGEMYSIRYHSTDVIVYRPGAVSLFSGGWHTYTTKMRINAYLPAGAWNSVAGEWIGLRASLWAQCGEWYLTVARAGGETREYAFSEGLTLWDCGRVTLSHGGEEPAPIADPAADKRAYNRERYAARKITPERRALALERARELIAARAGSHADRMAELERRIGTVLAECSARVPMYRMGN